MINFFDYVRQQGVEIPETPTISGEWFHQNGFPMIVRCCCCDMSMASPSAWIDDEGYTYCSDCAGINEK